MGTGVLRAVCQALSPVLGNNNQWQEATSNTIAFRSKNEQENHDNIGSLT